MPEMDDDVLEGMADVLSRMNDGQKKKLEALMNAKAKGIKKSRRVHKISLGSRDLTLADEEESTSIGKDGGIVHKHTKKSDLYDCGHQIREDNFGHQAECGHTACKSCVETYKLICQRTGCMQKLCPKDNCYRFVVDNINLCKKHARQLKFNFFLGYFNLHDRNLICKKDEK